MPTSSVHIIDSLWSSLDSLRDERLNWILLTHLIIWRILCAVLERYFCNRVPLQITRRPFCYSVSDWYQAFISANPMWKCSFDIVLISPNRYHRRNFFMPRCYLIPVTQHWCCKHWKHCYIDRDLTLFCYLVHGIPLIDEIMKWGRFPLCEGNHRSVTGESPPLPFWPCRHKIDFHAGNAAGFYWKCGRCSSFSICFHKHGSYDMRECKMISLSYE